MPQFIGPYTFQPQPNPTTGGGGGGGADCAKVSSIAVMSISKALGLSSSWAGMCPFPAEFCVPQPCDGAALVPVPVTPLPTPEKLTNYANSSYGQPIPLVFGADKLKGNVIWANSTPNYYTIQDTGEQGLYYSVNFALAICEGELANVLRIWSNNVLIFDNTADTDVNGVVQADADGNLKSLQIDITDPAGPFGNLSISNKVTKFTIFKGTESQLPPQAMIDIEGVGTTPAYRGVAYIFVENYVSADNAVPDLAVEVLANTTGITPRSYFQFPSPIEEFDDAQSIFLTYDPSFNTITVHSRDSTGTGAGLNVEGYTLINNTTFEQIRQLPVEPNFTGSLVFRPRQTLSLSNGHYLQGASFGNAHTISVINAYTGLVNDILGPGGATLTTMASDGFASLQDTCISFVARGADGMPADIFLGFSVFSGCYAFAQVDASNNTLHMLSFNNAVFTNGDDVFAYAIQLTPALQAANPTFADGTTSTYGTNVLCVTAAQNEKTEIAIWVISYDNSYVEATPFSPVHTQIDTISLSHFFGEGIATQVVKLMYDTEDGTVIIVARCTEVGLSDFARMVKYNPYSGEVIWSVPVKYSNNSTQGWASSEMITNSTYAWLEWPQDRIYQINTVDGTVTIPIYDLTAESLPGTADTGIGQFYNGFENTLTYVTDEATNQICKVYLGRTARSAVTVSSVVGQLLERVGVSDELIGVDDLTALTLDGYTISAPTALQAAYNELATVFTFDIIESNGQIVYKGRGAASVATVPNEDLADVDQNGWLAERTDPDFAAARKITITYRDIGREYEQNVQNFVLPKYTNLDFDADAPIEVTVPIVLDAATAKTLAEVLLYSKVIYETSFNFRIPRRYAYLEPGDTVTLTMSGTRDVVCRIRELSEGADGLIEVTAVLEDPEIYTDQVNVFGITGRFDGSTISVLDPVIDIEMIPIPYAYPNVLADYEANYLYTVTAFNTIENQELLPRDFKVSIDGGDDLLVPAITTFPTWGTVITPPKTPVSYYSTDTESTIVVKMLSTTGVALASAASEDAMINNGLINLCVIGGELMQFQTVTDNGDGTYSLTNLIRAKYGTDGAASVGHYSGERFVLLGNNAGILDYTSFRTLTVPFGDSPSKVIRARLISNNPFQPECIRRVVASNVRPWSVGGLEAEYDMSGNADFVWQYRTRYDGEWVDDGTELQAFTDGPSEEYTLYLLTDFSTFNLDDPTTYLRKEIVTVSSYEYTTANQTADGFDNTTDDLYILVHVSTSVTGNETGVFNAKRLQHL